MDLDSISSSPYLSNEEGLSLIREAISAVQVALQKISNIKKYVKHQMTIKNCQVQTPDDKDNWVYSKPFQKNIKIEIIDSDDSDCEYVPNDLKSMNSTSGQCNEQSKNVESSQLGHSEIFQNNINHSLGNNVTNDHSTSMNVCDNQSEISDHSSIMNSHNYIENLQVYFNIINNSLSENDVQKVLIKEGFSDFSVIVKNKEFHSYGFIRFSNEDSAKRAVEKSLKISISGRAMKIIPYKRNASEKRKSIGNMESNGNIENSSPEKQDKRPTIEENVLINIPCGYERTRVSESYTSTHRNVNEEIICNYIDPNYQCERTNYLNPLKVDQINKKLEQQTAFNSLVSDTFDNQRSLDDYINKRINDGWSDLDDESVNSNNISPQINITYSKKNQKMNNKNKNKSQKNNKQNKKQKSKNKQTQKKSQIKIQHKPTEGTHRTRANAKRGGT